MKKGVGENLSQYFYDCGKLSFAVFVIGVLAKKPFVWAELIAGLAVTLTLLVLAVTINLLDTQKGT